MKVICYGDSNTYGYDPCFYFGGRYGAESRWVDILVQKTGWDIRNDGLNGRTIPRSETRFPIDTECLIVMLGTNDLLQGCSAVQAAERMKNFLAALNIAKEKILLIAPPPLERGEWVAGEEVIVASRDLAALYQTLSEELGCRFADAGALDISLAYDGVHFSETGHRAFADGLYGLLKE